MTGNRTVTSVSFTPPPKRASAEDCTIRFQNSNMNFSAGGMADVRGLGVETDGWRSPGIGSGFHGFHGFQLLTKLAIRFGKRLEARIVLQDVLFQVSRNCAV